MHPIQIQDLHFGYNKRKPVLRGLNLRVPPASIYGFLGPNGAGKSTTIRTLLGLLRPQSGTIHFWGQPLTEAIPKLYGRIGTLVESPSFYPQLSARDNLRLVAKYQGIKGASRITNLLERVGLLAHQHRAARKFSTGMKQRLGLAMAMLAQPELLVLDEPTNGLDPAGIAEIRQLMLELQAEGTTIFLSSHLLSEVEKVASQIGILRDGCLAFEGSMADLQALRAQQLQLRLRVNKPEEVESLFPNLPLHSSDRFVHLSIQSESEIPDILRTLLAAGQDVFELVPEVRALEDLFIQLTDNSSTHADA